MSPSKRFGYVLVQLLTWSRIPLVLLFLVVNLFKDTRESPFLFSLSLGALILSALTDTIDGYLARKFNVDTDWGAYADPLADKFCYLTALPVLLYLACLQGPAFHGRLLLLLTVLFLIRDQWVSFLRSLGAMHQLDGRANWSGKLRTTLSFPAICIIYYHLQAPDDYLGGLIPLKEWPRLIYALEWLMMAVNILSIVVYTARYWPVLRKATDFGDRK